MTSSDFQLRGVDDPRLAVHAASPLPTWLWSQDGTRVLWANPAGARLFGAADATALSGKIFGPADAHRRQIVQLAHRLPATGAVRLERLRGFGAAFGLLMTCACARLAFPDGKDGVLVTAMDPAARAMPLMERPHRAATPAPEPSADAGAPAPPAPTNAEPVTTESMTTEPVTTEPVATEPVTQDKPAASLDLVAPETQARERIAAALPTEAPSDFALFDALADTDEASAPAAVAPHETAQETPESRAVAPATPFEPAAPAPDTAHATSAFEHVAAAPQPSMSQAPAETPPRRAEPRQHPLRFLWQMDAQGRFVLGSDEFIRLMGTHTAAGFGRPWQEIAEQYGLDPDGRVAAALATKDTWAGITVNWPADGGERLPVELAGLPIYDRNRDFAGFRGFGVCRDLDSLNRLDALRRFELFVAPPPQDNLREPPPPHEPGPEPEPEPPLAPEAIATVDITPDAEPTPAAETFTAAAPPAEPDAIAAPELPHDPEAAHAPEAAEPISEPIPPPTEPDTSVETPPNVVPFRPPGDARSPALTPVENSAFNELARQLSERLERERESISADGLVPPTADSLAEPPPREALSSPQPAPPAAAEWLTEPAPPARGDGKRDRMLLDLVPSGILIYRLDRLLYANPAFLARIGHDSLSALEQAGGLDALYVEPGVSSAASTSQSGTPVTISAAIANGQTPLATTEAHLHTIDWDGESAHALICALPAAPAAAPATLAASPPVIVIPDLADEDAGPEAGEADAEDLAAILDTTAEGIVMFDAEGNIHACNRSAEALFGYDGEELMQQNLVTLFAPESQGIVADYLDSLKSQDISSLLDHGREVLGREKKGGVLPLAMIMGRTRPDGPNFFAVFRDLSQSKQGENELQKARRLADGAANAKADMLARISHEIRTPLNAIIGFAEVMISERFGALGNERYGEYLKDIRASGERVITIIDDLSELSRIETGKLELTFASLNLNDLVEACVTIMQPQANRERIIIRTSLAHALPQVTADSRALRQITMNLISNSIRLASAGGQVIVSTALSDRGEVALRIRDTGHGLSEREVAAAMEPFRTPPPGDAADNSALSLSLTKALVEANRAQFNIKSAGQSGTLVEVVFAAVPAKA
jgi:PAS domain S-box-containing protein